MRLNEILAVKRELSFVTYNAIKLFFAILVKVMH